MRRQLWISGELVSMLRCAAKHEPVVDGIPITAELMAERIIYEWMQTRPYAKLVERLDAARKAEEERFWREQEKPL